MTTDREMVEKVNREWRHFYNTVDNPPENLVLKIAAALQSCNYAGLVADNAELRAERDALLQKPIDLAKMDSIDGGVADKMIAYYWCEQAQLARAALQQSDTGETK
jgi:hypothetical protein